jgi:CubicO group peptidase (beta-lactamase class C family)
MKTSLVTIMVTTLIVLATACAPAQIPTDVPPTTVPTQTPTAAPPTTIPTLTAESPASKIDKFLNSLTEKEAFTGAVLVAQNGEVLLSQGYGLADRDKNLPNTPQTKYRLAALTKQFTAMAILMLQAQDKLNVQDPICRYISECPVAWQDITIHHILTHTSGMPGIPDAELPMAKPTTPEQTIALLKDKPLAFAPGERWSYSNTGYMVLGYIIEQVSGLPYGAFLQKYIFEPLQMKDTGYGQNDGSLAIGYTGYHSEWTEADYVDVTVPYAAGGLYSTVEDLYRWDQALYTEQLISKELLDVMFTPYVPAPDFADMEYGYGWVIGEANDHQIVWHPGGFDGFAADIDRYIDDKVTIIVLSNRDTTDCGITDQIARIIFEEQ